LNTSKESSHTAELRRLLGVRGQDIGFWWRRTGAGERTGAATSEALVW
jgi:hypothetical protein